MPKDHARSERINRLSPSLLDRPCHKIHRFPSRYSWRYILKRAHCDRQNMAMSEDDQSALLVLLAGLFEAKRSKWMRTGKRTKRYRATLCL